MTIWHHKFNNGKLTGLGNSIDIKNEVHSKDNDISIGRGCFLGSNCVVLKNVKLGIILAMAKVVVTKSFPEYSIIAGIPAKKIGTFLY